VRVAAGAVRVVVLVVLVSALVVPAGLRPTWGAGGEDFGGILGGGTECILQLFLKYFVKNGIAPRSKLLLQKQVSVHQGPIFCTYSWCNIFKRGVLTATCGRAYKRAVTIIG
jgi:hypothetical protein